MTGKVDDIITMWPIYSTCCMFCLYIIFKIVNIVLSSKRSYRNEINNFADKLYKETQIQNEGIQKEIDKILDTFEDIHIIIQWYTNPCVVYNICHREAVRATKHRKNTTQNICTRFI